MRNVYNSKAIRDESGMLILSQGENDRLRNMEVRQVTEDIYHSLSDRPASKDGRPSVQIVDLSVITGEGREIFVAREDLVTESRPLTPAEKERLARFLQNDDYSSPSKQRIGHLKHR